MTVDGYRSYRLMHDLGKHGIGHAYRVRIAKDSPGLREPFIRPHHTVALAGGQRRMCNSASLVQAKDPTCSIRAERPIAMVLKHKGAGSSPDLK